MILCWRSACSYVEQRSQYTSFLLPENTIVSNRTGVELKKEWSSPRKIVDTRMCRPNFVVAMRRFG